MQGAQKAGLQRNAAGGHFSTALSHEVFRGEATGQVSS